MAEARPKRPRCPECGDTEPIELPSRRIGFHRWMRQYHCLECGADFDGEDYYTPEAEKKTR